MNEKSGLGFHSKNGGMEHLKSSSQKQPDLKRPDFFISS